MDTPEQSAPFWLNPKPVAFPPTHLALKEPDGLLAIGGDLNPEWLLTAYHHGIFPWFSPEDPILWWTPNPRSVLFIDDIKISRSLRKRVKQKVGGDWQIRFDSAFRQVINQCATQPRPGQNGTWITEEMLDAYHQLHHIGYAHSVEIWQQDKLIGGLYGIAIGKMFFGESMFAKQTDASKVALTALCMQLKEWGFKLVDTQVATDHLNSLGAVQISRTDFEHLLNQQIQQSFPAQKWQFSIDLVSAISSHK